MKTSEIVKLLEEAYDAGVLTEDGDTTYKFYKRLRASALAPLVEKLTAELDATQWAGG
jgi:hypothetical protein